MLIMQQFAYTTTKCMPTNQYLLNLIMDIHSFLSTRKHVCGPISISTTKRCRYWAQGSARRFVVDTRRLHWMNTTYPNLHQHTPITVYGPRHKYSSSSFVCMSDAVIVSKIQLRHRAALPMFLNGRVKIIFRAFYLRKCLQEMVGTAVSGWGSLSLANIRNTVWVWKGKRSTQKVCVCILTVSCWLAISTKCMAWIALRSNEETAGVNVYTMVGCMVVRNNEARTSWTKA